MSFSHVALVGPVWSMLEKEQERRKERGREGGREGRKKAPFVVCEYDYISIDACIVQIGEGNGNRGYRLHLGWMSGA